MLRYFCDRCGRQIEDGDMFWLRRDGIRRMGILHFSRNEKCRGHEERHHICRQCQRAFWKWWDEGKVNTDGRTDL